MLKATIVPALAAVAFAGLPAQAAQTAQPSPVGTSQLAPPTDVEIASLRERALEMLSEAAVGPVPELRANALEALVQTPARLKQVAPPGLVDANVGVRTVAAMSVGKARLTELADAVQPLLRDPDPMVQSAAIFAMRRLGRPVDPSPLARLLMEHPQPRVRAHVGFILGELGERSAAAMLRDAARQNMPRANQAEVRLMRMQFAEARIKLGEEGAANEIRAALYPTAAPELEATALAAQILGSAQDKGSMDQLILLTARWNEQKQYFPPEVRLAAAGAVAQLGNPRGSFIAEEYVASPVAPQRAQAALVLGMTGSAQHLRTLEAMLEDPDGRVRVASASGIVRISERLARARAGGSGQGGG